MSWPGLGQDPAGIALGLIGLAPERKPLPPAPGLGLGLGLPGDRGLHSLTSELNFEDLQDTSLTIELNLSTFGTHPRVKLSSMGDKVRLS